MKRKSPAGFDASRMAEGAIPRAPKSLVAGLILLLSVLAPAPSEASCECRCVNGEVVPLCDRAIEIPPICPARICPIVPSRIRPIDPPRLPPLGTDDCRSEQVYNSVTGEYEWQEVCR